MAQDFNPNQAATISGLGTFQSTVSIAGPYTLECKSTIPQASGLQMVLKQNSTTLLTIGGASTNPTATQQAIGSSVTVLAAANDVFSVILSSSNAVDSVPNNVKSLVNLYLGPQ